MLLTFIVYSNSIDEEIVELAKANSSGYTKFTGVQGEGAKEPHLGTHVWPDINNCMMLVIEPGQKEKIAEGASKLKKQFPAVGINIFTTQLKEMI